ncbi:hypothetical protein PYW07_011681 [Mythimna separata]|uniref:Uncharacterized protein n=1 Tax=Mythimna separata TaxID=271217 RepID=A0AAD7Y6S0_MYTSE|nr:hypothetical protein PYW07_011681 [Mythimna separata]
MVSAENSFSPTDLFRYAEMLLKESKLREASIQHYSNNYAWLKSRPIHNEVTKTDKDLERLKPMIQKITSENCAKIAVKLDAMADEEESSAAILTIFKKLLEDQYSIQLMEKNVVKAKERNLKKNRVNKVHPVLVPPGRQPTVSFILYF